MCMCVLWGSGVGLHFFGFSSAVPVSSAYLLSPCASGPLSLSMPFPGKPCPFFSFSEQSTNEGTGKSGSSLDSGIDVQGNIGQSTWPL